MIVKIQVPPGVPLSTSRSMSIPTLLTNKQTPGYKAAHDMIGPEEQ